MPRSKALIRIIIIPLRCYLARTYQSFVQLIRAKEEKRKHISIISKKVKKISNALNFSDQDQNFKILNPSIISCVSLKRKEPEETRDYIRPPAKANSTLSNRMKFPSKKIKTLYPLPKMKPSTTLIDNPHDKLARSLPRQLHSSLISTRYKQRYDIFRMRHRGGGAAHKLAVHSHLDNRGPRHTRARAQSGRIGRKSRILSLINET